MARLLLILVLTTCGVFIGPAREVGAVRSGAYRCTGALDNVSRFMTVTHYNPTGNVQTIRRIRIFDSLGRLYFDASDIAREVPALGSVSFDVATPPRGFDEVQFVVFWTQVLDTLGPIPRAEFVLVNQSGDNSLARTGCP
jgi:hypothetical protein